jgi:hypothetical protein
MVGRGRLSGLAAVGALVPLLCGCGSGAPTLGSGAIERAIAASILAQHGLRANVSCPSGVQRKMGVHFTCYARFDVGSYVVPVTEIDSSGRVRYESRSRLVALDIARVQRAIGRSIFSQRHIHSTVTCPSEVIQQPGVRFTCTATVSGRSHSLAVTQMGDYGHVRYVGLR